MDKLACHKSVTGDIAGQFRITTAQNWDCQMHRELHTPYGQYDYKQNVKFNLSSSPMDYKDRPIRFMTTEAFYLTTVMSAFQKQSLCSKACVSWDLWVVCNVCAHTYRVCVCSDSCDGSISYICSWTLLHLMSRSIISQGLNFTTNSWRKWFTDLV